MFNILASGGLKDYFEVFEYYFGKFATNDIKPIVWIEFIIVIVIGFLIRGYLWQRVEVDKANNDEVIKRKVRIYCINHTGYEFIIAFITTFILINFTGANPNAFIINGGICPGAGFIAGMLFDRKIIMKLEASNDLENVYVPEDERDDENEITDKIINEVIEEDEEGLNKININNIENCDVKLICRVINTINEIIDETESHDKGIVELNDKIKILENVLNILKESEKMDKKLEIKSLIYYCLNEGYAKPEEDAVITNKYNLYMTLVDTDMEIKSLFENRYLKLGVHEDRRKKSSPVENDRRKERRVKYGQYDNEYNESSEG